MKLIELNLFISITKRNSHLDTLLMRWTYAGVGCITVSLRSKRSHSHTNKIDDSDHDGDDVDDSQQQWSTFRANL